MTFTACGAFTGVACGRTAKLIPLLPTHDVARAKRNEIGISALGLIGLLPECYQTILIPSEDYLATMTNW